MNPIRYFLEHDPGRNERASNWEYMHPKRDKSLAKCDTCGIITTYDYPETGCPGCMGGMLHKLPKKAKK